MSSCTRAHLAGELARSAEADRERSRHRARASALGNRHAPAARGKHAALETHQAGELARGDEADSQCGRHRAGAQTALLAAAIHLWFEANTQLVGWQLLFCRR